ncbi:VOC family protein [Candidatus Dependentiae bacterium]|nr:VOC family protein [Candidatus Dependentiae bacterium]
MVTKLSHVVLYVDDQDKALTFYRDILGLKVHTDADYEGMRWLTLHPFLQPDFELVIMKASSPEGKELVGKQSPEAPLFVFNTLDCKSDYALFKEKGVNFVEEPTQHFWGLQALCLDVFGNMISILELPKN